MRKNIDCSKVLAFFAFAMLLIAISDSADAAAPGGKVLCQKCHQAIYDKVNRSIHQKMIRDASIPGNVHGNLSDPKAPNISEITYVIGGWYKEESYIKKNGSSYNVTQYEWDPIKQMYYDNRSIRNWLVQCAGCHTTGYNTTTQTFRELNIGCEACHGATGNITGAQHMAVIDRSSEACGYCHIRAKQAGGGIYNFPVGYVIGNPATLQYEPEPYNNSQSFFPDNTSKRHRQQFLDIKTSRHYAANITCVNCHDPHESGNVSVYPASGLPAELKNTSIAIFNASGQVTGYAVWDGDGLRMPKEQLCKSCHNLSDYHSHNFTATALNASITCTDCHMPDIINVNSKLRGALTPHTFRFMSPQNSLIYGADIMPNSCTYRCHQDRGDNNTARAEWAAYILNPPPAPTPTPVPGFEITFTVMALLAVSYIANKLWK